MPDNYSEVIFSALIFAKSETVGIDAYFTMEAEGEVTAFERSCYGHAIIVFNRPISGVPVDGGINALNGCRFSEESAMLRGQISNVNTFRAAGCKSENGQNE